MAGLLAIDVGNTQTVLGLFEGEELREHWRVATESERTGDELGLLLRGLRRSLAARGDRDGVDVPPLARAYEELAGREGWSCWCSARESRPEFRCATRTRARSGPTGSRTRSQRWSATARRASSSTSEHRRTSTWSRLTGEYVGGVLAPGVEVSMEALSARAARLFSIDFAEPPTVIAKNTTAALQSGLVYGFAGQVDGIVEAIRGELGVEAQTVATGGLAELIVPHAHTLETIDPFLTLEGVRLVWQRNRAG